MTFEKDNYKCECGLESPIVNKIQGRKLEFLYASNGSKINVTNIANGFKNIPNAIIRPQVIQKRLGEITILLEVDKVKYKTEFDKMLEEEFIHKFGKNTKIIIEHVDEIPREKSGKFRMIKNNVNL